MKEKKTAINTLVDGDMVDDIFVVKFKKPVEPYKNGFRFELRIGDASKEIMAKYWGPNDQSLVQQLYESIQKDSVVHIIGRVQEWNEQLEISTKTITLVNHGSYDPAAFIRKSTKNIEEMYKDLMQHITQVHDEHLKGLLLHFFGNADFAKQFKVAPAAMYLHHGWIGGLLEHTLAVTRIALSYCEIHKSLNKDLVITGCLFHDMGKLQEFDVGTSIRMSTEGMLIGHVTIAVQELTKAMQELQLPKELQWKVNHMVLTHMGEYGSSKTPSFPEALAVFYADQADAQLTHMIDVKEHANTEDEHMYSKHFGNVYLQ